MLLSQIGVQHTLRPPADMRYHLEHRRMGSDGEEHVIRRPGGEFALVHGANIRRSQD